MLVLIWLIASYSQVSHFSNTFIIVSANQLDSLPHVHDRVWCTTFNWLLVTKKKMERREPANNHEKSCWLVSWCMYLHTHSIFCRVGKKYYMYRISFCNLIGTTRFRCRKSTTFPANVIRLRREPGNNAMYITSWLTCTYIHMHITRIDTSSRALC